MFVLPDLLTSRYNGLCANNHGKYNDRQYIKCKIYK